MILGWQWLVYLCIYDVENFGKRLSQVIRKLGILSLNIQTIDTKFTNINQ